MKIFAGLMSRWTMPLIVRKRQALADVDRDLEFPLDRQQPGRQLMAEVGAFEKLHHDVRRFVGFAADIVDRDDVGMGQTAGRLRFAEESRARFGSADAERDDFDRDAAADHRIGRLVDAVPIPPSPITRTMLILADLSGSRSWSPERWRPSLLVISGGLYCARGSNRADVRSHATAGIGSNQKECETWATRNTTSRRSINRQPIRRGASS